MGVAEEVGGDAGVALAADIVDVEATAHQDIQVNGLVLGAWAGVGDGVAAQVVGVAEGVGAGYHHADALALDELEGRVRDPQGEMAHLDRLLRGDAPGCQDLGRDRGTDGGFEFAHLAGSLRSAEVKWG